MQVLLWRLKVQCLCANGVYNFKHAVWNTQKYCNLLKKLLSKLVLKNEMKCVKYFEKTCNYFLILVRSKWNKMSHKSCVDGS